MRTRPVIEGLGLGTHPISYLFKGGHYIASSVSNPASFFTMSTPDMNCGQGGGANTYFGLRVASIFIILVGSTCGASFPVLAKRIPWLKVPKGAFDFAKYFGSGVIIATAFIHLLSPGLSELTSPDRKSVV